MTQRQLELYEREVQARERQQSEAVDVIYDICIECSGPLSAQLWSGDGSLSAVVQSISHEPLTKNITEEQLIDAVRSDPRFSDVRHTCYNDGDPDVEVFLT